jgi:hypothetical protein
MSELVYRHPQSGCLVDPLGDLPAEANFVLRALTLTWEQPILVASRQQCGPKIMNVFVDQFGEVFLQRIFKSDPVLDVIIRESQPVVLVGPAWLCQIGAEPDCGQVSETHRSDGQNSDRDGHLSHDGSSDRALLLPPRLLH